MSCKKADGQENTHFGEHVLLLVARELRTYYTLPRWWMLNARPCVSATMETPWCVVAFRMPRVAVQARLRGFDCDAQRFP
jgi:hypothetical protein